MPAWQLLGELVGIARDETCLTCECLQGALATLIVETEDAAIRTQAQALRVERARLHRCLGCEPCPPADQLAAYRARKSGQASGVCGCGNSGCH